MKEFFNNNLLITLKLEYVIQIFQNKEKLLNY